MKDKQLIAISRLALQIPDGQALADSDFPEFLKQIANKFEELAESYGDACDTLLAKVNAWEAERQRPICAYGCQTPTFLGAAIEGGWEEGKDFNKCMNKTWLEHDKTCSNHPLNKRIKELEASLSSLTTQIIILSQK